MQIRYFDAAWNDIKNSPGWFGKLCLLALVNFIPIFGQMVTFGYLFGWAREISWGAHRPMPASLFSNEDGKFWRRGWFVFVLSIVLMIIPIIIMSIGQGMQLSGISSAISIGVPYMCTMESSSSVSCASVIRFFADALKRR